MKTIKYLFTVITLFSLTACHSVKEFENDPKGNFDALKKDAPIFIEEWPDFAGQGSLKKVNGIKARAFVKISAQL